MTASQTRLLAAVATGLGLLAGGFEAHLAPQTNGWWHGLTHAPSVTRALLSFSAALFVWRLGRVVSVRAFLFMSAGLLPMIPAVTGVGALFLFFSGMTMVLVFAVAMGYATRDLFTRAGALHPAAVVLMAFGFFVLVGRFLPGPAGPQGDEPHYLLIAESLLADGDVDLQNQFAERAFSKFTAATLDPHTAPRSPKGRMYAIHTPGLSALVAPGYAIAGYTGARAVVSAVLALTVGLLYATAFSLFGSSTAAFVFFVAIFASPLPIYGNAVFPDSVAALPLAATLACMTLPHPRLLGLASASIAFLPWLHPRLVPLAFLLALALSLRDGWASRRAFAAFIPLLISIALLLLHFQSLFGRASLSAAYGPGFSSDVSLFRIPWGASALLLDRQFGLLLFSPVLLIGAMGLAEIWRRQRRTGLLMALAIAGLLCTGAAFSMWFGGASAPARFLIAATPALILAAGASWHAAETRPDRRAILGTATGFGAGLLFLACLAPRALHNRADGESGFLRLLTPVLDADRFFPSFVKEATGLGIAIALLWAMILIVTALRPRWGLPLVILPLVLATLGAERPLLDPFSSSLRALESWDKQRRTLGGDDTRTAFTLEVPLGDHTWNLSPGVLYYSPRFSLPSGGWSLRAESRTEPTPDALNVGRVSLVGDDESATPWSAVLLKVGESVSSVAFRLEQSARRLHIKGEGLQARTEVVKVQLTPTEH